MATPFRKSVKWYFTDCAKIAEFGEMRSLDGNERGGEGGIGAIIFFASQGRPKMHHEGAAMAMAADGRCVHFGGNEYHNIQQ